MKQSHYHFVTTWSIAAPTESVWKALVDSPQWPRWWGFVKSAPYIQHVTINKGVGTSSRVTFKGALPYSLSFVLTLTQANPPTFLQGSSKGDLDGTATWKLRDQGTQTEVTLDWNVSTTKPWMNILAPVLRPIFNTYHDVVMKNGEKGLGRYLSS